MSLDVGVVRELAGEKDVWAVGGEFLRKADGAEKAALIARDGNDGGAVAAQKLGSLGAHPVGHEDRDGVAEGTTERGAGDAGVAAGGFGDGVSGLEGAGRVAIPQNFQDHAVLN